jgi:hypothetical protein
MEADVRPVIVNYPQIASIAGREATGPSGLSSGDEAILGRALAALEDATVEPDVLTAPNDQAAALLQTFLAERALEAERVEDGYAGALEAKFDSRDPGWIRAAIPYIRTHLGVARRAPRPPFTDTIHPLPDPCRVAVLGDWGTGLYGARPCAATIARGADVDLLVHLGDVYYSGSASEIADRFLAIWDGMVEACPGVVSRACNSNHEMYSGGGPYFTSTLRAFGQESSAFAVANDHWVLVGLDTAYKESDLDDEQVRWLLRVVDRLNGRRLVLLSHHQPFSLLDRQGPRLVNRLAPLLPQQRVFAWYWGHEHRLALYERHAGWQMHGRCVGHSGFPYWRQDFTGAPLERLPEEHSFVTLAASNGAPAGRVLDGPNDYLSDRRDRYGPNGFMRLTLDGDQLHEQVVAPNGTVLWERELA